VRAAPLCARKVPFNLAMASEYKTAAVDCRNGCEATAGPAKMGTELSRGGWGSRCWLQVLGSATRNEERGTRNIHPGACGLDKQKIESTVPTMGERIELNPEVCGGRAVVRGTRITVETILGYLSAGDSINDVLEAHPNLTKEDVLACLGFAQRVGAARSLSLAAA
jgi:uncharacterized protein (DUF433 family)